MLAVAMMTLCGCNGKRAELAKLVEAMNAGCPMSLGTAGQLESTTYNGNVVTFNYVLHGIQGLNEFETNEEMYHKMMLESYRTNADEGFRKIVEAIVDANASLDVVFRLDNNAEYKLHFTSKELAENKPGQGISPDEYLHSFVNNARMQLPQQFAQGMMGTDVVLDDKYLSYLFECDEAIYNLGEMQQSTVENHESMKQMMLESTDPNTVKMLDMLKQSNRGIRYIYKGTTSGAEAIFCVTAEEMKM